MSTNETNETAEVIDEHADREAWRAALQWRESEDARRGVGQLDAGELELSVIGTMMQGAAARSAIRGRIDPRKYIGNPRLKLVASVLDTLDAKGVEPTRVAIMRELHGQPAPGGDESSTALDYIGGSVTLEDCEFLGVERPEDIGPLCERLVEVWQLRLLREQTRSIAARIGPGSKPAEVLARIETLRDRVIRADASDELEAISARAHAAEMYEHVQWHLDGNEPERLMVGHGAFDALIDGFQPDWYVVLSSYSKMGKTTVAWSMLARMLQTIPELVVNVHQCEVRSLVQTARILAASSPSARINQEWLVKPDKVPKRVQVEYAREVLASCEWYAEQKVYAERPGVIDIEHVESRARMLRARHPDAPIVIVVDYLQRMKSGGRFSSKRDELEDISGRLIDLAKGHKVLVLALSQFTESGDMSHPIPMPRAGQVRHCKTIRDDCDLLLSWHRPFQGDPYDGRFGILETSAFREGRSAHVLLDADLGAGRFEWWDAAEPHHNAEPVTENIGLNTMRIEPSF